MTDPRRGPLATFLTREPDAERLVDLLLQRSAQRAFIVQATDDLRLLGASDATLQAWGLPGGVAGRRLDELPLGLHGTRLRGPIQQAVADGGAELTAREGGRWIRYRLTGFATGDGFVVVGIGEDETAQREAEAALTVARRRLGAALEVVGGAAAVLDAAGRVVLATPAWADLAQRGLPCVHEGRSLLDAVDRAGFDGADRLSSALAAQLEPDAFGAAVDVPLGDPPGWWRWQMQSVGGEGGAVVVIRPSGDDLLGAGELRSSRRDPLTGLANRRAFDGELERLGRGREGPPASLILVDLEGLPDLNRAAGHEAGDGVLREVAARLDAVARKPRDLVARLGGDEFVVLVVGVGDGDRALLAELAERAVEALSTPWTTEGAALAGVRASVGVAAAAAPVDATALLWTAARAASESRRLQQPWLGAWDLQG